MTYTKGLKRQVSTKLYYYRNNTRSLVRSRTFRLGNTIKIVIKSPLKYLKKGLRLILVNPRKIGYLLLGKVQPIPQQEKDNFEAYYQKWVVENKLNADQKKMINNEINKFKKKPLISIITPIYNPPVEALEKLIQSVLSQIYSNFEALLFDFGNSREITILLEKYKQIDKRIIVESNLKNRGISENSNYCLSKAKGDFIALLDHDDTIEEDALFEFVNEINKTNPDFIYSDKDKITEEDVRIEPLMKPDWSPEMALGGNYMTHFNLIRKSLLIEIGGWDSKTDGAQDWDLFLRVAAKTKKISHIPKILYHWRTVSGSTANNITAKPYALAAQNLSVNKYLKSQSLNATAFHDKYGQQYIKWESLNNKPNIILHYEFSDFTNTKKLIKQITRYSEQFNRIYLFQSFNSDLNKKNENEFEGLGVKIVKYNEGEFVDYLNTTLETYPNTVSIYISNSITSIGTIDDSINWLAQLMGWLTIEKVGVVGGGAYLNDGRVIDIGSVFDRSGPEFRKMYFGTGYRSGVNGHLQWIRNLILPSEKIFAFKNDILKEIPKVDDEEFQFALAVVNYINGKRGVFDPQIYAECEAPFEIRQPLSSELTKLIKDKTNLLVDGDPNHNKFLDDSFENPLPRIKNSNRDNEVIKIVI